MYTTQYMYTLCYSTLIAQPSILSLNMKSDIHLSAFNHQAGINKADSMLFKHMTTGRKKGKTTWEADQLTIGKEEEGKAKEQHKKEVGGSITKTFSGNRM